MSPEMITTLIAASSALVLAGTTYWFTKQREREAELRREKLEHYKDFVSSLSGIVSGEATPEGQQAFSRACNKLNLVAPQAVIEALQRFQQEIKVSNPKRSNEQHDRLMSILFYEIRRDLRIAPRDDGATFHVELWSSGIPTEKH
jgi:hypothetical protein